MKDLNRTWQNFVEGSFSNLTILLKMNKKPKPMLKMKKISKSKLLSFFLILR